MTDPKKVFIVGGNNTIAEMFIKEGYTITKRADDCDLAVFTGGEDVNPALYGQECHKATHYNTNRDVNERGIFLYLFDRDVPMIGICRGGQFLNVMSGGAMYQDVENHTRSHDMLILDADKVITVTSTHHQMMKPGPEAFILATAVEGGKREYYDKRNLISEVSKEDYEVLYYPSTGCVCFQPHPEYAGNSPALKPMVEYFFELVDELFEMKAKSRADKRSLAA